MTLVPSSGTNNIKSITRTLAIGARNDHTRELGIFEKSLAVRYWLSDKKRLKFLGLQNRLPLGIGNDLSNNRSLLYRLENIMCRHSLFETCPEGNSIINKKVSGIFLWPRIWIFPFPGVNLSSSFHLAINPFRVIQCFSQFNNYAFLLYTAQKYIFTIILNR